MKRSTKILVVIGLVLLMMLSGLLLPSLVEWFAASGSGTLERLEVEALRFDSGSSSVIEIMQHLSADYMDENGFVLSSQELDEGYQYTPKTAISHAKTLTVDYLNDCGFKGAAKFYDAYFDDFKVEIHAVMVVSPDYPVPWSAIIWSMDFIEINYELVFDDASGTMLGFTIPLYEDLSPETFAVEEAALETTCIHQYAERLGEDVSYKILTEPMNYQCILTDQNDHAVAVAFSVEWWNENVPTLFMTYENNEMISYDSNAEANG